jgi:hypothetical protein
MAKCRICNINFENGTPKIIYTYKVENSNNIDLGPNKYAWTEKTWDERIHSFYICDECDKGITPYAKKMDDFMPNAITINVILTVVSTIAAIIIESIETGFRFFSSLLLLLLCGIVFFTIYYFVISFIHRLFWSVTNKKKLEEYKELTNLHSEAMKMKSNLIELARNERMNMEKYLSDYHYIFATDKQIKLYPHT